MITKRYTGRFHNLSNLIENFTDIFRFLHITSTGLARLNQIFHTQLGMVVSRLLPEFLYCVQIVFRVLVNWRIHMRTQDTDTSIGRHLLKVHQFDITDLTLAITGKFNGLITHLFQFFHSFRNILIQLIAQRIDL